MSSNALANEAPVNYDLLRQLSHSLPELWEFYESVICAPSNMRPSEGRVPTSLASQEHAQGTYPTRPVVERQLHAAPKPPVSLQRRQRVADRIWEHLWTKAREASPTFRAARALLARIVERLEVLMYRRAVDGSTYANMASHLVRRIRSWDVERIASVETLFLYLSATFVHDMLGNTNG
jgi:hypothetical protein